MDKKHEIPTTLDFDTWADVAANDPALFECMRRSAIDAAISGAPVERQERLRRLQWRIDQERRTSATPIAACIRISSMMWDRVVGHQGLVDRLQDLNKTLRGLESRSSQKESGKVIDFKKRSRPN